MHAISDSIYFQVHRTPHQDVSSSGFEANTIKSLKKMKENCLLRRLMELHRQCTQDSPIPGMNPGWILMLRYKD